MTSSLTDSLIWTAGADTFVDCVCDTSIWTGRMTDGDWADALSRCFDSIVFTDSAEEAVCAAGHEITLLWGLVTGMGAGPSI